MIFLFLNSIFSVHLLIKIFDLKYSNSVSYEVKNKFMQYSEQIYSISHNVIKELNTFQNKKLEKHTVKYMVIDKPKNNSLSLKFGGLDIALHLDCKE